LAAAHGIGGGGNFSAICARSSGTAMAVQRSAVLIGMRFTHNKTFYLATALSGETKWASK
jgi:hypothetical protein